MRSGAVFACVCALLSARISTTRLPDNPLERSCQARLEAEKQRQAEQLAEEERRKIEEEAGGWIACHTRTYVHIRFLVLDLMAVRSGRLQILLIE